MARAKKGAESKQATIICVDESGFYPLPGVVRTYAPVSETPVLREWTTRSHLSVLSGITPEGRCFFHIRERSMNSEDVIRFLKHLLRRVSGKMLVVWDGAMIHRSRTVREFLATGATRRLQLERLPGYAPDLNPDEGIWNYLKNVELRNCCCRDLLELKEELVKAIKRLRHRTDVIKGCFSGAGLN